MSSSSTNESLKTAWQLKEAELECDWQVFGTAMKALAIQEKNNCWSYLGGPAEAEAATDEGKKAQKVRESRAWLLITKNIEKRLLKKILHHAEDPRAAWKALEERAVGSTVDDVFNLGAEFEALTLKKPVTLPKWETFYESMLKLARDIETLDASKAISDDRISQKLLSNLPESEFSAEKNEFCGAAATPEKIVKKIRTKLKRMAREEEKEEEDDSRTGDVVLNTNDVTHATGKGSNTGFQGTCFKCGKKGHKAFECTAVGNGRATFNRRNNNGRGRGGRGNGDGNATYLIALLTALTSGTSSVKTGLKHWVMDGAAQCGHVVTDAAAFVKGTFVPEKNAASIKGFGKTTPKVAVMGHGDVQLRLPGGNILQLSNVKYVPEGNANLLAIHKILTQLQSEHGSEGEYLMKARTSKVVADGRTLMTGSNRGGLFYLDLHKVQDFQ